MSKSKYIRYTFKYIRVLKFLTNLHETLQNVNNTKSKVKVLFYHNTNLYIFFFVQKRNADFISYMYY